MYKRLYQQPQILLIRVIADNCDRQRKFRVGAHGLSLQLARDCSTKGLRKQKPTFNFT
jgi:hypothetical protein